MLPTASPVDQRKLRTEKQRSEHEGQASCWLIRSIQQVPAPARPPVQNKTGHSMARSPYN